MKIKVTLVISLLIHFGIPRVKASFQSIPKIRSTTDEEVIRKWNALDQKIKNSTASLVQWLLPNALRMTSELDLSSECTASLLKVLMGLRDLKYWAFQMIDATGKPGGGQMSGTMSFMGDYDECVAIEVPNSLDPKNPPLFGGQYCMVDFRPPLPSKPRIMYAKEELPLFRNLTDVSEVVKEISKLNWGFYTVGLRLGLCVPSTCSREDVDLITTQVGDLFELYSDIVSCETKKKTLQIDQVQLAILTIILCIIGLVIVATFIDLWLIYKNPSLKADRKQSEKSLGTCLTEALSIRQNWQKLFKINSEADKTLDFLNGIRFFSICWVVLGHTYLFIDYQLMRNTYHVWNHYTHTFSFQIIGNAFLSVESFLFVTGTLISYNLVKHYDTIGPMVFNIPFIILHRIWRLLPSTMLVVSLTILLPLVGEGPMWEDVAGSMADNCRQHWWKLLVFANNFTPFKDSCLPQTWYIATDFQLFFVALLFMFIFFKKPFAATLFNIIAGVIGIIAAALMTYLKEFPPGNLISIADKTVVDEITNHTYFLPQVHLGVYAIGLSLGAYLARRKPVVLSKTTRVVGWACAVACNLTILFIVRKWNLGERATITESVVYSSLHRTGWGIGLAWLSFMCATGYGGYVKDFLAWKGYSILNRLTYLVFLIHITIYCFVVGSAKGNWDTSHILAVWIFSGNLLFSFLVAFVIRLFFEAPVLQLEALFFHRVLGIDARRNQKISRDEVKITVEKTDNKNSHSEMSSVTLPPENLIWTRL